MCIVSMIGDDWTERFKKTNPWIQPNPSAGYIPVSREEFEQLKREVEQMKRELIAAKRQDEEDGNSECEMEEKVALLKKIAEIVGVDLKEVFLNG